MCDRFCLTTMCLPTLVLCLHCSKKPRPESGACVLSRRRQSFQRCSVRLSTRTLSLSRHVSRQGIELGAQHVLFSMCKIPTEPAVGHMWEHSQPPITILGYAWLLH